MSSVAGSFPYDGAKHASAPRDASAAAGAAFEVSVVVPTYRRPDMLERCLRAIIAQDYDKTRFEIIVCDDGPDEPTRSRVAALAREFEQGPRIRYVPVTATQGPAGARNAGWRASGAALIAFTDDDTIPDPHWLAAGVAALRAGADAVSGRIVVPLGPRPTDYEQDAAGLSHAEFATANTFVTRSALARVGGFDARFTSAWREDSDLQFELMRIGARIVRSHDAMVLHPVRPARWGVSLSQQKKSQFDALLYKKHRSLFKTRIRSLPPLLYYAIIAALLVAVLALAKGNNTLAGVCLVAWLGMTAWFCFKRLKSTSLTPSHVLEMAWTSLWIPFLSVYWRIYGAVKFRVMFI
ncbi:glycosyltransferase [Caballeronia sp. LZ062]|uniref:glycosyltransferase family 2 protein n=1 Tax=unclassified Caballeronia TaxID=2646786 RepID=UPI00285AA22D|nr:MULTISPECIES: glycosyltransferase [unclassified Caballeronia]MDR5857404.1 glycosyltransferase [Caballeronia sp. LZ050]MDR5868955.1 glycosyltransferase [Caballeronia sp. LZ062]